MYCFDIRDAWTELAGQDQDGIDCVRVTMIFSCKDVFGHVGDVERVALVRGDGSDVETIAKDHEAMILRYRGLEPTYKGMMPK